MKVRWTPSAQRFPALRDNFVVDTFRGQIRVRKWPRKRGRPKSAVTRRQNDWFTAANALTKRLLDTQMSLAIALTKGTGLYPRDLLLRQMSGGIYDIFESDGNNPQPTSLPREEVMFQGAVLELDVNQAIPANVDTVINFPLPTIDTMGFWNAGAPSRLTIPAGVEVVELIGTWTSSNPAGSMETRIIVKKNGALRTRLATSIAANAGGSITQGPEPVIAGDFFEFSVRSNVALNCLGPGFTYLTLKALQVVI